MINERNGKQLAINAFEVISFKNSNSELIEIILITFDNIENSLFIF